MESHVEGLTSQERKEAGKEAANGGKKVTGKTLSECAGTPVNAWINPISMKKVLKRCCTENADCYFARPFVG